jgi:hypothetical protein
VLISAAMALAGAAALSAPVFSENVRFQADLQAKTEVPLTDSGGSGTADIKFDTEAKNVSWTIRSSGLSGDPVAAHFHGLAQEGEYAGPIIDITANLNEGSADLTDEQWQQRDSGQWYINIHTGKFPDGGVPGQVMKAP